jgi:hypothetical protein
MPEYEVRSSRAGQPLLLGGDDDAWGAAAAITWGPDRFRTRFRALSTRDALLVRFDVTDERPWSTFTVRDSQIWNEEVVEIFLDPERTGQQYAELEISPANVVCDLVVARPWPELHSDPSWDFRNLVTRVQRWSGADAGPDGWTATAAMPWADFASLPAKVGLPPRAGDRWRFNVYRIKRPHGPARPHDDVVYAAWSPTGGPSFHVPDVFRDLVFSDSPV